jgi:hypothetical protein
VDPITPNQAVEAEQKQNKSRLTAANIEDMRLLGKSPYLQQDPALFFPSPERGPDNAFNPPPWLLSELQHIVATLVPTPKLLDLQFEVLEEAAEHNAELRREADYNLTTLLKSQEGTTLGFGAKFCPVEQLRGLLGRHPGFDELTKVLIHGMDYRYHTKLTEAE